MIASIHRGPQRAATGMTLRGGVGEVGAIAARCARIVLREPFGPLLEAVGKAGSSCVIGSRAAVEALVTEPIESAGDYGSCFFEPDGLKPGARVEFLRKAVCARRIGPPSGTAGGEQMAVERIEEKIPGGGIRRGDASLGALREGQRRPSGSRYLRVFQDLKGSPNPRRAIGASLIEGAASVGLPPAIGRREATGTHNTVRMPTEDPARYPREFAGGRRQRFAIARAVLPATSIAAGGVGPLDVSVQAQRLNVLRGGAAPHHHRLALHCARSACGGTTARSYLSMPERRVIEAGRQRRSMRRRQTPIRSARALLPPARRQVLSQAA
jgi:hypothetical protein